MAGQDGRDRDALRDAFLDHLGTERNLSPRTLQAYAADLTDLANYLEANDLQPLEVDTPLLRSYLGSLRRRGLSRATLARRMASLRSFYRFLVERGLLEASPAATLRSPRRSRRLPRFLDRKAVNQLVTAPPGEVELGRRDRAILETLYSTGARVSELVGLSLGDLDLTEEVVRLQGKGGRERLALLGEPALVALREYLFELRASGADVDSPRAALFRNRLGGRLTDRGVRRVLARWRLQLGLPEDVTPHTLRHTFATHLLAAGASLRDVGELLGHRSVASTQLYTHVTYEHLREVYDATHPRANRVAMSDPAVRKSDDQPAGNGGSS